MGAAGSSNRAPSPSRGRNEEAFVYGAEESWCPEYANENIRQRTRANAFDVGEEPRSQGPSPYATFRDEEWWSQRPSAPSLSNLRSPRRETLLTYAAQMTGWQTAEGHGPSFSNHQETMELWKMISHLSKANQQLVSAHTATLANLEALYVELVRERKVRRRAATSDTVDEALKKRLTMEQERVDEDEEERRKMEDRVERLENLLADSWDGYQCRQRDASRQEKDRKLRSRVERLEAMMKSRELDKEDERQSFTNIYDSTRNQDSHCRRIIDDLCNKLPSGIEVVPEHEFKMQITSDEARTKSISRVNAGHVEEQLERSRSKDETDCLVKRLHLEEPKEQERRLSDEEERSFDRKEVIRLLEEVESLKAKRLEYRNENERLAKDLAEQRAIARKLTKDYEESKARQEQVEFSLQKHREEYDKLKAKFDVATKETERLLKKIDEFNVLKDTAEARISSLEQDLQKSLLEKEEIINIESQKTLKLKAQLSEEVSDKKKQIKALEDALDEIQRLKETIKTERKGVDDDLKEDIGPIESIDDPQESPPTDRAMNIEEFKKELTLKREARQRAIAAVSSEMERLRRELDAEKEAHSETSRMLDLLRSAQNDAQAQTSMVNNTLKRCTDIDQKQDERDLAMQRLEAQRLSNILKISDELRSDIRIQIDKADDLRYQLETESDQHRYRIRCLSDLTNRTREAVYLRERRANELKDHLAQILLQLGDRSFLELKDDVGLECERQLENINSLKSLYNERLKVLNELKETAIRELAETRVRLDHSMKQCECLEEDLKKADEKMYFFWGGWRQIDAQDTEITNLESQLGLTKADCRDLQNQMSLINSLFTQMLLGATSADMDLDRLTQLLQENHDLICDMAREEGTEAAALPKLLLDLIEQVEGSKTSEKRADGENGIEGEAEKKEDDLQQEDIAHNLPKVWRVLLELLSCHAEGASSASAASSSDPNICYKSVDTPTGPRLVISVSKTYIRLKELILEKKHLEKEMNRMKQLNVHLECKLGEQEKRLSAVSAELSKTWTIVDRMQVQHHQLHTHEKILRYELQQKRKMLQELKQELEYCREKWESARQKNTNTELEWRSLRREFAARKALASHDSFNNSAESGFSDERGDDTDEEDNAVEGRIRLGPRRRPRKESPRAPTPDTESEQPTDTELSEPKTGSSTTLEQRTPTPETEAELDDNEVADTSLNVESTNAIESPLMPESPQEPLNPLDQALTNVIQDLIGIESITSANFASPNENMVKDMAKEGRLEELDIKGPTIESWSTSPSETITKDDLILDTSVDNQPLMLANDARNATNTDVFGSSLSNVSSSFNSSASEEMEAKEKRGTRSLDNVVDSDNVSVDSSSSLETVKEFSTAAGESASSCLPGEIGKRVANLEAGGSVKQEEKKVVGGKNRTPEEVLSAREDRLKRLEEQAKWLMNKMNATNRRGSALSTRLEELHEVYGEPPVPPPMPDVLPSRRLRTTLSDLPRQVPESSTTEDTKNTEKPVSSGDSNEPSSDNAP
ncbi:227 kDa spindle- and centromere-associated protein isoform X2 [Apis florea]|uniref:227 kDa spindle- and centromere-associated protein isoform X2 n=1 Tax=Apis florea TaxID=7463 RepID=UPI0012FF4FA5|nr:227 kDa spindle- and centromere-associated protein isoform X2 [Apis florea]